MIEIQKVEPLSSLDHVIIFQHLKKEKIQVDQQTMSKKLLRKIVIYQL